MPVKKSARTSGSKNVGPKRRGSAQLKAGSKKVPPDDRYVFLLYVTGNSPRSGEAITNIRSVCDEYLPEHYTLEVVDIYQQPVRAREEQIIAAPTLLKRFPLPPRRLIGNLSDRARIITALNLALAGTAPPQAKQS